ncbi:helix-turn-helix domain-containing protein [Halomarina ordinaria]|uniref:Helix-turn-helix domain-containing protein n=1 Tax=Halomarina ordinaria TaxID=3033939 RepID=A0ABD5U7L2_9EURY|nr:helix-turn-helix domain-containing protein [Halomarina sp. PSRA2]
MSVVAAYRTASPNLVLASAVSAVPSVTVEVTRSVPTDGDRPRLFFWVDGGGDGDLTAFETAMEEDATVTDVEAVCETDGARLYRAQVTRAARVYAEADWSDVEARHYGTWFEEGWWYGVTRFPDRRTLAGYRAFLDQVGVRFELLDLFESTDASADYGLTARQRETLELAHENGFFEIPRRSTMGDIAEAFDVSEQAISQRLRRGYARLVESALIE